MPAVLSSGHGAFAWVSPKDKILSLNEGQDEAVEKGWSQPQAASPAPGMQGYLGLVMKY